MDKIKDYESGEAVKELIEENEKIRMASVYITNKKEKIDIEMFNYKHQQSCKGGIQYIVEFNHIGESLTLKCNKCKETKKHNRLF